MSLNSGCQLAVRLFVHSLFIVGGGILCSCGCTTSSPAAWGEMVAVACCQLFAAAAGVNTAGGAGVDCQLIDDVWSTTTPTTVRCRGVVVDQSARP